MKFVEVRKLYKDTVKQITKDSNKWTNFLKSAAWNFKYNFDDQVLIYAQKPEATACAEMQEWNTKVIPHRWVNKNAKGIAIYAKPNSELPLRFVFDLSDTHNYRKTEYKLWTVEEKFEKDVIEALEDKFGEIGAEVDLRKAIILISYNMVTDSIQDYMTTIKNYTKGTLLDGKDDSEIEAMFISTVWSSVAYMMMTRCGLNAEEYIDKSEYQFINYFNNTKLTTVLGTATSDIAEVGLREIATTIKNLKIEEKNKNRTFAEEENKEYSNIEDKNIKGGKENERDTIPSERWDSSSKYNNGGRENTNREIRNNENGILEKSQESRVFNNENGERISETLNRDTRQSNENDKSNSGRNDQERWNNGRTESNESDGMGGNNEQLPKDSRTTSSERTDLHLEQTERKKYNVNERSNIKSFYDDETINDIIRNSPNINKNIAEIKKFLKENIDDKEKCKNYVSEIFSDAYTEYTINDNNVRVGHKTYSNGLYLWKGDYLHRTEENFCHWSSVTEHLTAMMILGELDYASIKFNTEEEQIDIINQAEVNNTSVFSLPQEIIDKTLQQGSHIEEGKFRIYEQLTKNLSSKENAEFLKNEYGIGGVSSILSGSQISEDHSPKGIRLTRGRGDNEQIYWITWLQAEKRIRELISGDRYFNSKEKEQYKKWLEDKETITITPTDIREETNEIEEDYIYKLADRVFIGTDEYEIINIAKGKVTLADVRFPLFMQEMDYEEFDRKAKENPYNEHLKKNNRIDELEEIAENEDTIEDESFNKWLDTFIEEKGIDLNEIITLESNNNIHNFEIGNIVETIKVTSREEQEKIKDTIVKIDFANGDVLDYFKHLANALVTNYEVEEPQQDIVKDKPIVANIKRKRRNKIEYFDLHPEIPLSERNNYKITDNSLGEGTPREKYRRNIEAIKVLKKCEEENRYATPEEQQILSQYIGWGGLPDAFDSNNSSWSKEYEELKSLLTEKEYKEARQSTLTAFYTPPIVIKSIYKALEKMGLQRGNILEPSCRSRELFRNASKYS